MTLKECFFCILITLPTSALIGTVSGILRWAISHNMAEAVLEGAKAFTAAEMLFLAILGFVVAVASLGRNRRG